MHRNQNRWTTLGPNNHAKQPLTTDMERTPAAFSEALWSSETEQVNRAIDEIDEMELEERVGLFDEGFEVCRDVYANGDGYQRQSAVRFAAALYPGLAFRSVGGEFRDPSLTWLKDVS